MSGHLPISELQKLVAQQENLLVPDDQMGHFSSPVFYFLLAATQLLFSYYAKQ